MIFNTNAMQPNPSTTEAWGAKIRARQHNEIPKGVAALADKIVEEEEEEESDELDPFEALESMNADLMEEEFVGDIEGLGK